MIFKNKQNNNNQKVFVAMSGGVDSSVAAGLLKEDGYDVVGVTMCFSISHAQSKKPSCCGVEGIEDARRAASILGIPHYVMNFEGDIKDFIIEDFTQEYLNGRTPNPCVRCNQYIKFGTLYEKVMALEADYLATGHYAKIRYNDASKCYEILKADDKQKDQSYFLHGIKKETLPHILFPLGGMTKNEVRCLAENYKLNVANKPESQDICFVPDTGYKQFIKDSVGQDAFAPGPFKNYEGEIVGEHGGIANYTIGQRDKLGLALGKPVYVYKIEKDTNTVYVGGGEHLYSKGLFASQVNFVSIERPAESMEVQVKIRYNSQAVEGRLSCLDETHIRIDFAEAQKSVTPGQSVVFYRDDVVWGGAIIDQSIQEDLRGNN